MRALSRFNSFAAKLVAYLRESGVRPVARTAWRDARERRVYREWVRKHGTVTEEERSEYAERIANFLSKPLLSVIVPVYNVDEALLRKCLNSVRGQIYPHWELCIADDASPKPHIRRVLEEYAAGPRVKIVFREQNGHISAASNSALELATGEFAVLLDHDDVLSEDALFWVANELNDHPDAMMIYSDEDLIDEAGVRSEPKFKPDFSRDLLYGINLVTHLSAYRLTILREIGGFRVGYEGSQDYDLALRVVERLKDDQIRHIPRVLYHWRITAGSLAADLEAKPYAHDSARRAIREHLQNIGRNAEVVEAGYLHRVRYRLPARPPKVSLIVCGNARASAAEWVARVRECTRYPELEIREVKPRRDAGEKVASAVNAAVKSTGGEIICFLDAGLRPLAEDWLSELVSFSLQPEIGAVGPKLLNRDNTVAGSGLLIGVGGLAAAAHEGFLRNSPGNLARNRLISNYSAVSASCLAVRREVFMSVGGFDAEYSDRALIGADLCLRIGEAGLRVVATPFAELKWVLPFAARSAAGNDSDGQKFKTRWARIIENDPFHNPNLSKERPDFSMTGQDHPR
jgi:O-antigen biosynthesis protein